MHVVREPLFVLAFLLQQMRRRKTIVLSCWGPGATLPSCRFREGQRLAAPKTCSACARTGSPSTGTFTTTRWAKESARSVRSRRSWRSCACRCPGAGASCSALLSSLNITESHNEVIPPLKCVLALSRFQLEGFPYSFLFKTFKVFQESVKWCPSTFCPLCSRCVDVYCSFLQTSVFTPAYGSVTNVRVNSCMTTGQVLNLLLHKFRVHSRAH